MHQFEDLKDENRRLQQELSFQHQMIGQSQADEGSIQTAAKVAPASSTVLILGESGTGKELAAMQFIKQPARDKTFRRDQLCEVDRGTA